MKRKDSFLPIESITTDTRIEDIPFSQRLRKAFKDADISAISDVTQRTEPQIRKIRGVGRKSFDELKYVLNRAGLSLKKI